MNERESATQRKITEVRRKISLCEGKRRAVYNSGNVLIFYSTSFPSFYTYTSFLVDKEKKKNKEDAFQISEEVKVNDIFHVFTTMN